VRTLLEERVGAVTVRQIEILPRLACGRRTLLDSLAIDQDFDGADVARKVAGIVIGPGQRGRRDPGVVLR
jgi:hypothetical protein